MSSLFDDCLSRFIPDVLYQSRRVPLKDLSPAVWESLSAISDQIPLVVVSAEGMVYHSKFDDEYVSSKDTRLMALGVGTEVIPVFRSTLSSHNPEHYFNYLFPVLTPDPKIPVYRYRRIDKPPTVRNVFGAVSENMSSMAPAYAYVFLRGTGLYMSTLLEESNSMMRHLGYVNGIVDNGRMQFPLVINYAVFPFEGTKQDRDRNFGLLIEE